MKANPVDPDATLAAEAPKHHQLSDTELAELASRGDVKAYSFIYDRSFEAVYDFAVRTAKGSAGAGDAVVEAFSRVWDRANRGQSGLDLRPEMYAAARKALLADPRVAQARNHLDGAAALPAGYSVQAPSDQKAGMAPDEFADLVWRAAASLHPKDYSLLHIHLRGGVAVPDMADTLGVKRKQIESTMRKLQEALDSSVATILLMREGHRECPDLDGLLLRLKATETPPGEIREAVGDHMKDCKRCELTRGAYAFPPVVFAALVPVPAPEGLKRALWQRVLDHVKDSPAARGAVALGAGTSASRRGPAATRTPREGTPMWLKLAAIVTVIGVAAAASFALINRAEEATVDDPADIKSASHFIGVASSKDVVTVSWSAVKDAANYSVEWSKGTRDLPDTKPDLPGTATSATSEPLKEGWWYFHLRTQGKDKIWTSTVHLGPFVIRESAPLSPTPPPGLELIPVSPSPSPGEPSLSVADAVVAEGNAAAVTASVVVTLAPKAEEDVTVEYATANKTATAPADYKSTKGKLVFTAGQTKKTIKVPLVTDTVTEPDETFLVNLSKPSGAKLLDGQGTVTIKNDDGPTAVPAVSIADAQVNEGGVIAFGVTLSAASAQPVSVGFTTANASAVAPGDYAAGAGTVSFAPGQTNATISLQTVADTDDEPNETFTVNLAAPTNATIADGSATGTIVDDDEAALPSLSINDATADGVGDQRKAVFTVTLSASSTKQVMVDYTTNPGEAQPDNHYISTSGTLTFAPGETSKTITVKVETVVPKQFTVTLSGPTNATIADGTGAGTT